MAVTTASRKIVSAVTSWIICLLLFTLRQRLHDVGQSVSSALGRRGLSARGLNITTRANDGNDAIPGWSLPLSTYLATPFDQLDIKGKAVVIGKQMICMLDEDPESTQSLKSSYNSVEDLAKTRYGWTYSRVLIADRGDNFMAQLGLEAAFDDLSVSSSEKDWYEVSTVHSSKSKSNGVTYPVSWSTYQSLFNLRDGVIVATTNHGPAWQNDFLELGIPKDELVPLRQWSDLVFLALQKTIADVGIGRIQNVKHVFRHNLLNDEVKEMLVKITGGRDIYDHPEKWPGLSYPITENQALATLSTANGKGVAYLLGTHKSQMGFRTIDRVNIFNCPGQYGGEESPQWCMYLHVTDGPLAS